MGIKMASFTEKSQKPFSGWELQPQDLMAFGSHLARNLQWGGRAGGAVLEVKTRKKRSSPTFPLRACLVCAEKKCELKKKDLHRKLVLF